MDPQDILAALRKAKYPAARIARDLGVTSTAVCNTIHGKPSRRIAATIAKRLNTPINQLWPGRYGPAKPRTRRP